MNIILENDITEDIREKYMLVELDTFQDPEANVTKSYAIITKDEVLLQDFHNMEQYVDLHNNLMKNYRLQNWKFCDDALEHLVGKFRGELDSFYKVMQERIDQLRDMDLPEGWTPNVMTQ